MNNISEDYTKENFLKLLNFAKEMTKKNMKLEKELEELREELEELREEKDEELKTNPRKCGCGYESDYVLIHGRCSSCM